MAIVLFLIYPNSWWEPHDTAQALNLLWSFQFGLRIHILSDVNIYCCKRLSLWWQHPIRQPPSKDTWLWDTIVNNREMRLLCWKKDRDNCPRRRLQDSKDLIWPWQSLPALSEAIQGLQKQRLDCDGLYPARCQQASLKPMLKQGKELQGYLPNSYSTWKTRQGTGEAIN